MSPLQHELHHVLARITLQLSPHVAAWADEFRHTFNEIGRTFSAILGHPDQARAERLHRIKTRYHQRRR